jgi:uncharacterized membrane protein (UPF0127 family)
MKLKVYNQTRGTWLADRATVADTSETRRTGLLKHTGLEPGDGLWIKPCEAVHCFFMKFTIDVLFIGRDKRVVKARAALKPWRISGALRAHSVLELPEGQIAATGTERGDQLVFEKYEGDEPRA